MCHVLPTPAPVQPNHALMPPTPVPLLPTPSAVLPTTDPMCYLLLLMCYLLLLMRYLLLLLCYLLLLLCYLPLLLFYLLLLLCNRVEWFLRFWSDRRRHFQRAGINLEVQIQIFSVHTRQRFHFQNIPGGLNINFFYHLFFQINAFL